MEESTTIIAVPVIEPVDTASPTPISETVHKEFELAVPQSVEVASSITVAKTSAKEIEVKVSFSIRFSTTPGQRLSVILLKDGNHPCHYPLDFLDEATWGARIPVSFTEGTRVAYHYLLTQPDGSTKEDWPGTEKSIRYDEVVGKSEISIIDAWNHPGFIENVFFTEPFQKVLLRPDWDAPPVDVETNANTHLFKVKAPLLEKGHCLGLIGSPDLLGNWAQARLMSRYEGLSYFELSIDLSVLNGTTFEYKYCVCDTATGAVVRFEDGANRLLSPKPTSLTIVNDGFANFPSNTWRGTGTAIPVFSLKSEQSFGVGEFADIALLVDWCKKTGLKMIQILPINDTMSTGTWVDSYPYAAISAFALHPLYLNVPALAKEAEDFDSLSGYRPRKEQLNALPEVDYEKTLALKIEITKHFFGLHGEKTFATEPFQEFLRENLHWLLPYSVFCYGREQYGHTRFSEWPTLSTFDLEEAKNLANQKSETGSAIRYHYYLQYHLHLQLKAACRYAHENGVILKGDIPIGINRHGADAWQRPELFNLGVQAGAPPDGFAVKGQNWGFPTYNWEKMKEDGFGWWKLRFEQMAGYFDAFRIDHILGFFRIWSIPLDSVEGIMGHFVPAIPVHLDELRSHGVWHDAARFTQPFITEKILWDLFGYDNVFVKERFLDKQYEGRYAFKETYDNQRKIERELSAWNDDPFTRKMRHGLYDLLCNVILFDAEGSNGNAFHFRFAMTDTYSFKQLDPHTQAVLEALYVDYYFKRQDAFWMKEAMQKLPALKMSTNMLICGEDLGLVPGCVPETMQENGLLSLEIQRMPKDPRKTFFHPNDAPYLSVVTPSTHDMSTLRAWWEEDRDTTQRFYNQELGQLGQAPYFCEPWINRQILLQHLYSPSIWCVFQLQDILGMDGNIRRRNPNDERINLPSNPKNYWRYRMHLTLEELNALTEFNTDFATMISESGRA